MNWNNAVDIAALSLLINGAAGALLFLLWCLINRTWKERLDVQASYKVLHVVVLFFAIPVFGVLEVREAFRNMYGNAVIHPLSSLWMIAWRVFLLVWGVGTAVFAVRGVIELFRTKKYVRYGSMSANLQWQHAVERASGTLRLKQKVRCRERFGETSPFVMGILCPTVYFPVGKYPEQQGYVMAIHELNHIKSHDLLWKLLAEIVRIIYWPLVPVWYLRRKMDDWSEYTCDFLSCQAIGDYAEYFDVLTDMILSRMNWYQPAWVASFCNDRTELGLRIRSLAHQKQISRFRMHCIVALAFLFCFCGSGTVMAATGYVSYEYRTIYWDGLEKDEVLLDEAPDEKNYRSVISGDAESMGLLAIPRQEWLDGTLDGYDHVLDPFCMFFDVRLKPGEAVISGTFEHRNAADIYMSCSMEESCGSYYMGVVQPDGSTIYMEAGELSDTDNRFVCEQEGDYRFFLINCGDDTVSLFGMAGVVE